VKAYKYKIFTDKIEEGILNGTLKAGDKLPSVRTIKAGYRLSISSVQSGYDYLVFKGLVTSMPRLGYIVAERGFVNLETGRLPSIVRDAVFKDNVLMTSKRIMHLEQVSLNVAMPDDVFVPQKLVLKTMQEVIREKGASLLRYYPNNGSEELISLIVKRSALHGTMMQPDEVIITDGALQALYIALASVTSVGDIIAIESPCVFSVLEVIANLHLRTIEIPVSLSNGLDLDYLDNVCKDNKIKAIVLTPNFHNPTGILLSEEKKEQLYKIAVHYNTPIIENDIYGDLYFEGSRPNNIKSYDTEGLVLTYSSFSKTLAPGLRLGWLAAGQFFAKAERLKFSLGRSVSPINQEVMIKILSSSNYDKHLRVFRDKLARQASMLINYIQTYLPNVIILEIPHGGYSIWCELNKNIDSSTFYKHCEEAGVYFTSGETFTFTHMYDSCFRVIFSQQVTQADLEVLKKLGQALK
jgi:DNA-binding transcriptional MocR family regulator